MAFHKVIASFAVINKDVTLEEVQRVNDLVTYLEEQDSLSQLQKQVWCCHAGKSWRRSNFIRSFPFRIKTGSLTKEDEDGLEQSTKNKFNGTIITALHAPPLCFQLRYISVSEPFSSW